MPNVPSLTSAATRHEVFVSTLAHELRQPLSVLGAAVEILLRNPGAREARLAGEMATRQIRQMQRVLDDLTDAARWASGKMSIQPVRCDVCACLREAAVDSLAAVDAHQQQLGLNLCPDPLWVRADPERLRQAFLNLLANAIKYTQAGGEVSISAKKIGSAATVAIRDTGRRLEPEAVAHLFDLFSQVRPQESVGLGIGLSVVQEIIALHDGTVEAHSKGPGRGTKILIRLPLADSATEEQNERAQRPEMRQGF